MEECKHEWRYMEKDNEDKYRFYCVKCLIMLASDFVFVKEI